MLHPGLVLISYEVKLIHSSVQLICLIVIRPPHCTVIFLYVFLWQARENKNEKA